MEALPTSPPPTADMEFDAIGAATPVDLSELIYSDPPSHESAPMELSESDSRVGPEMETAREGIPEVGLSEWRFGVAHTLFWCWFLCLTCTFPSRNVRVNDLLPNPKSHNHN